MFCKPENRDKSHAAKTLACSPGGIFYFRAFAGGKLLWQHSFHNAVTAQGRNDNHNNYLGGSTWYLGLINNAGFTGLADGDTMASHAGWNEYTGYSESVRQTWVSVVAGSEITNVASPAVFTFTEGVSLIGAFLVNDSTKGGTTDILWATGRFNTGGVPKEATETLEVVYRCPATAT